MNTKPPSSGLKKDNARKTKISPMITFIIIAGTLLVITLALPISNIIGEAAGAPAPNPTIFSFTMDHDFVSPGEDVTLTWETNAQNTFLIAIVNADTVYGEFSCIGGFRGGSGSHTVQIQNQREFRLYTIDDNALLSSDCLDADLARQCGCGETMNSHIPFGTSASIPVICNPKSWFFPSLSNYCPDTDASKLEPQEMIAQSFAWGDVILIESKETMYGFFADGTLQHISGNNCGDSISDSYQCSWDEMWDWLLIENPACLSKYLSPEMDVEEVPKLIDELGPAEAPEIYYKGYFQCVAGYRWQCYISGPNATVNAVFTPPPQRYALGSVNFRAYYEARFLNLAKISQKSFPPSSGKGARGLGALPPGVAINVTLK